MEQESHINTTPPPLSSPKSSRRILALSSKPNKNTSEPESTTNHQPETQSIVFHSPFSASRDHVNCVNEAEVWAKDSGREKLKRHREEVAGRVLIPDSWSQENLLKDWVDYSSFDALLAPKGIMSARDALVAEGRRASSQRLRIESRCC